MNFCVCQSLCRVGSVSGSLCLTKHSGILLWGAPPSRVTSPDSSNEHDSSLPNCIRLKVVHSGGVRPMYGKVSVRDIADGKACCSNRTKKSR